MARSIMDYVFRRLALDYLDFETRSFMGIHTAAERARQVETGSYEDSTRSGSLQEESRTECRASGGLAWAVWVFRSQPFTMMDGPGPAVWLRCRSGW